MNGGRDWYAFALGDGMHTLRLGIAGIVILICNESAGRRAHMPDLVKWFSW